MDMQVQEVMKNTIKASAVYGHDMQQFKIIEPEEGNIRGGVSLACANCHAWTDIHYPSNKSDYPGQWGSRWSLPCGYFSNLEQLAPETPMTEEQLAAELDSALERRAYRDAWATFRRCLPTMKSPKTIDMESMVGTWIQQYRDRRNVARTFTRA